MRTDISLTCRWYISVYEDALKNKCGYTGVSPYWNWSAGTTFYLLTPPLNISLTYPFSLASSDSADVYNSTIFQESDPISGIGGWGDRSNDFEVQDGGFSDLNLSYPAYHTLRRNFTLQPLVDHVGSPFITNAFADANASFTPEEVSKVVNGFVGDYEGMQKYFESFGVRDLALCFPCLMLPNTAT